MPLDDAGREDAIRRLNVNISLEHAALAQYLLEVYRLDPPGLAPEIETIAREEMYHLWGFAQQVLRLGGTPRLDRATVYAEAADLTEMLVNSIAGEDGAITKYSEDIEAIDDEETRDYLRRVLRDENHHRLMFSTWLSQQPDAPADVDAAVQAAPATGEGTPPPYISLAGEAITAGQTDPDLAGIMNDAIIAAYQVVLRALQDYFDAWESFEAEELLRRSIRAMKNLGELCEAYGEAGGRVDLPRLRPPAADVSRTESAANERLVAERAQRIVDAPEGAEADDPIVADVLRRIAEDHRYYAERIRELPQQSDSPPDEPRAPRPVPDLARTRRVPDLFGRPQ